MSQQHLSRRDLLKLMGVGAAAGAVSGLPLGLLGRAMAQGSYPAGTVTLWSWGTPELQTEWMNDFFKAQYPDAGITGEAVGQSGPEGIQQTLMVDFAAGSANIHGIFHGQMKVVEKQRDETLRQIRSGLRFGVG